MPASAPTPLPGISGFSLYLPRYRVPLRDWCEWTGQPWAKVERVVGESFRMRAPDQDVYCLAANAVMRLIEAHDIDPAGVGLLALGTESSADNAAGAVIVRGLVDRALRAAGRPALADDCEVPEYKHACLGGVYALKGALRYVATDGAARSAIVVSADVAEYARGSSGEPTQGAGAVAMWVEARPRLLEVDLAAGASASAYRVLDFRKPVNRFAGMRPGPLGQLADPPVFNGAYSTECYIDAIRSCAARLLMRSARSHCAQLAALDGVFMHRPYARMPENGLGMLWLFAMARDNDGRLTELAAAAGVSATALRRELEAAPAVTLERAGDAAQAPAYPLAGQTLSAARGMPLYRELITDRLTLGAARMAALGNLYTAALPAWLAAGLHQALEQHTALAGRQWLAIGYGSGDAAEALPMRVVENWQDAAARIGFDAALAGAVDVDAAGYAALHAGDWPPQRLTPAAGETVIEAVGGRSEPGFSDAGIAYHRVVEPAPAASI